MTLKKPKIKYTPKDINGGKFGVPPFFKYYCEYHKEAFPSEEDYNQHMVEFHGSVKPEEYQIPEDEFAKRKSKEGDAYKGLPKSPFEAYVPEPETNIRDEYPVDEQEKIDRAVDTLDAATKNLDDLNDRILDEVRKISLSYDPEKFPTLHEARSCPCCGIGSSLSKVKGVNPAPVITGDEYIARSQLHTDFQKEYLLSTVGDFNNADLKDPLDILAERDKAMKDQMESMSKLVLLQILVWAITFIYKILKPLEKVPIVKAVPKYFKKKIRELEDKMKMKIPGIDTSKFREEGFESEEEYDDYTEEKEFTEFMNQQSTAGLSLNDLTSFAPKMKNPVHLSAQCYQHTKTFIDNARELAYDKDPKYYTSMGMIDTQIQMRLAQAEAARLTSCVVAKNYQTANGNYLPSTQMNGISNHDAVYGDKLRLDWRDKDFNPAFAPSMDTVNPKGEKLNLWAQSVNNYVEDTKKIFDSIYNSSEVLCCFIYNLTEFLTYRKKKKVLYLPKREDIKDIVKDLIAARAAMEFARNILKWDYKAELADGANMILRLVTSLVNQIMGMYIQAITGYLKDELNRWIALYRAAADGFHSFIKGESVRFRKCIPWEAFVDLLGKTLEDLLKRIQEMVHNFFLNLYNLSWRCKTRSGIAFTIYILTYFIDLLTKIIEYLKFWLECTDTLQTDEIESTIFTGKAPRPDTQSTDSDLNKAPAMKLSSVGQLITQFGKSSEYEDAELKDRGASTTQGLLGEFVSGRDPKLVLRDIKRRNAIGKAREEFEPIRANPFGYDGMRVLLTNFVGLSPESVDAAFEESKEGTLCCKGGFDPQELSKIKEFFE